MGNSDLKLTEAQENIADAKMYCDFIMSMEVWGHGPYDVALAIKDALEGRGLPNDCLEYFNLLGVKK